MIQLLKKACAWPTQIGQPVQRKRHGVLGQGVGHFVGCQPREKEKGPLGTSFIWLLLLPVTYFLTIWAQCLSYL